METQLTGVLDEEMAQEVAKALERFKGRNVKVVISEYTGEKKGKRG